jgi:FemAB-related protein (PEP-CTERM system-associated)
MSEVNPSIRLVVPREFSDRASLERIIAGAEPDLAPRARRSLQWLWTLQKGFGHDPYLIVAADKAGHPVGFLALCFVHSWLFGRYLVSLPYLNTGGVIALDDHVAQLLVDEAVKLADQLNVRYLELRHEREFAHEHLKHARTSKVHMRLALPEQSETLWKALDPKVRNQVRKGEKSDLTVHWGSEDLLTEYYAVFSHNMRDLGTPTYSKRLFQSILREFGDDAELCVVRAENEPIAAALLIHDEQASQVPSASSLREYKSTNANMLMYWQLLCRAIEKKRACFDFGRSTTDGGTFKFKRQWGAEPYPSIWQYCARQGDVDERRPDNPKYRRAIAIWQKLPVPLTRLIGPPIVRGIP